MINIPTGNNNVALIHKRMKHFSAGVFAHTAVLGNIANGPVALISYLISCTYKKRINYEFIWRQTVTEYFIG